MMEVGDGATDMLPMDLQRHSTNSYSSFTFDWRTYFCTLFYEQEEADNWCDLGVSTVSSIVARFSSSRFHTKTPR